MDNPLKIIREGILQHNLEKIRNGFKLLTGEEIELQPLPDTNNQLIQKLEELLNEHKIFTRELPPPATHVNRLILNEIVKKKKSTPKSPQVEISKPGHYGNITVPLTDDNIPKSEIKKNKEKAEITNQRKIKREPPKEYDVACSDCEAKFKSDRPDTKDFGQKCRKCLNNLISNRGASGN